VTAWRWLQRHSWLYHWLPVIAWAALVFYLSAQPDLPNPGRHWVGDLIGAAGHMSVFAVLAVLCARALGSRRWAVPLAFALTMFYALSDELHQAFVPGRHCDPLDVAYDALGAAVGLWAWSRWQRHSLGSRRNPAASTDRDRAASD
jgi:VanZ family protein